MRQRRIIPVILNLIICAACGSKQQNESVIFDPAAVTRAEELLSEIETKLQDTSTTLEEIMADLEKHGASQVGYNKDGIWFEYSGVRATYAFNDPTGLLWDNETWSAALNASREQNKFALELDTDATPIGNGRVGLFFAFFSETLPPIADIFSEEGIDVDAYRLLPVSLLKSWSDYQLILVNTHGGIAFNEYYFLTSETIFTNNFSDLDYALEDIGFDKSDLQYVDSGLGIGKTRGDAFTYVTVYPRYFDVNDINFRDNSILYFNTCKSIANESLAQTLYKSHNLGLFIGWTNLVKNGYGTYTSYLFLKFLLNGKDVATAISDGEDTGGLYCEEGTLACCSVFSGTAANACQTTFSDYCDFGEHTEQTENGVSYKTKLDYAPKNAGNLVFVKNSIEETTGEVGDPCESNDDCFSEMCQYSLDDSLPGGYCVADCSTTDCPSNARCIYESETIGICYQNCETDTDCREGYYCKEVADGTGERVCWPEMWSEEFHPENTNCGEIYQGMPPFKCQDDLACVVIGKSVGMCYRSCPKGQTDCTDGFQCYPYWVTDTSGDIFCGICIEKKASLGLGDICASAKECPWNAVCVQENFEQYPHCRNFCVLGDPDCPEGTKCWMMEDYCQNKGLCTP